jgi:hypothetical protein
MIQMETPGLASGGKGRFQNYDDGTTIDRNNLYFKTTATYRNRAWWQAEYRRLCTDWPAIMGLAMDIIEARMFESSFERACRNAEDERRQAASAKPRHRPTPQATVEAILWCVRERGLKALKEPANKERLGRCDGAAVAQIDARISKLKRAAQC